MRILMNFVNHGFALDLVAIKKRLCYNKEEQSAGVWAVFFVLFLSVAGRRARAEKIDVCNKNCLKKANEVPYTAGRIYPAGKVTLITGDFGCL